MEEAEKPPTSHKDSLVVLLAGGVGGAKKDPPTSLYDSLGLKVGSGVGREGKKFTNESRRLVGGWWGQRGNWSRQKSHQRVIETHWWQNGWSRVLVGSVVVWIAKAGGK